MKNRILKIRTIFKENVWLLIATLVMAVLILAFLWKWSLQRADALVGASSVNALIEQCIDSEGEVTLAAKNNLETVEIVFMESKAYLTDNNGTIVFGPCDFIFDDFSCSNHERIFRYVDSSNGLIGFGQVKEDKVDILYPAVLSRTSKMADGSACVQENENYYFIDSKGERLTQNYTNAYPFAEAQGSYARVQTEEGRWAIINRKDEIVLGDFDSINKLHYLSLVGSGIKDGKAVLFNLEEFDGNHPEITNEFTEYIGIEEPFEGSDIAIVTTRGGKKGVLCIWNGDIVVPALYEEIQWGVVDTEEIEDENQKLRWFCCLKEDGSYDVTYWRF